MFFKKKKDKFKLSKEKKEFVINFDNLDYTPMVEVTQRMRKEIIEYLHTYYFYNAYDLNEIDWAIYHQFTNVLKGSKRLVLTRGLIERIEEKDEYAKLLPTVLKRVKY